MTRKRRLKGSATLSAGSRVVTLSMTQWFLEALAELDAIEIVQIVRGPDLDIMVDDQDLDPDTVIAMLFRGLVQYVVDDVFSFDEEEEETEESDEEADGD